MAIIVDTSKYENTHGKQPRGYGMWFFKIGNKEVHFTGSYGVCKQKAINRAKRTPNIYRIYTLG